MKNFVLISIIIALVYGCGVEKVDTVERISDVESLIEQMTLEEKVGQMAQLTLDVITEGENIYSSHEPVSLDQNLLREAIVKYHVGSVLNTANNRARTPEKWQEIVNEIQDISINETRLKIPIIYGIDAIHGATYTAGATMFPQQIAQAATWNRELVQKAASITAYEVRASSIAWNFSPVLDLGFDPRWPRQWETFGEDPYLCGEMGKEVIIGYQGDDIGNSTKVAACMKHFLGYSAATSGKDRTPAFIPESALREYHLQSFKKAIDAGAATIMINSGLINGIPVHANYNIITKLLKEELGFNGLVVTDWFDIENLYERDKIVATKKEAVKMAINAGIDMSMVPYEYQEFCVFLTELVNEGEVSMERIDDAVRRVLNTKYNLGLFEHVNVSGNNYPKFGSEEFEKVAYAAASEAITLLKNDQHILPLSKDTKILVSGPNANNMRSLNGGWSYSWQGEKTHEFAEKYNTILEALSLEFGASNITYEAGVEYNMNGAYFDEQNIDIDAAVKAAKGVDVIVLCLGENSYTEKPGDLHELHISTNQQNLAMALAKTGKPIVLVLNEGRPRIISGIEGSMRAVVQTYLSGNFAGDALADILSGDVNPSGKLPYTYPMHSNSLGTYFHKYSEESKGHNGMYDYGGGFYPQYEFGFGLSYTSFLYSDLHVNKKEINAEDSIEVSIKVKNTGTLTGKEVVQLFSSDLYASLTPDVKRLRGFEKIELLPGEEKTVSFNLSPKDLAFYNSEALLIAEKGEFELIVEDHKTTIFLNHSITY